jgi:two-component system sensor histidine kinase BaeS
LHPGHCDAAEIASHLAVLLGPKAAAKQVELIVEKEDFEFSADRVRLLQILGNLLGNAIKFTPIGGKVTLRAKLDGDAAVFEVIDTGPGIEASELPFIFDKFQQFPKPGGSGGRGAGLGLAIAKGLVELHGGTLDVESQAGAGSRFFVRIPQPPFDTERK